MMPRAMLATGLVIVFAGLVIATRPMGWTVSALLVWGFIGIGVAVHVYRAERALRALRGGDPTEVRSHLVALAYTGLVLVGLALILPRTLGR